MDLISFIRSLFFLLLCFFPFATFAGTGLTIQPIKVSHTLKPGEQITGYITLTNASSDEEILVKLDVQDFVPAPGEFGVNFVDRAPGVTTVRDWITLGEEGEQESFRFARGETRQIPYVIKAPSNAEPGGHFGVLFFNALRVVEDQQLKVGTRIGVLVLVTVPGSHLQKGQVLGFATNKRFYQKGPINFNIVFENTGTVHFEPKGEITVKNIFGKEIVKIPIQGQVVLPTGIRTLEATWDTARPLVGQYSALIRIIDGEGEELTAESVRFYALPLVYALEFFGAIFIVYFILRFLKKRVKITLNLKGNDEQLSTVPEQTPSEHQAPMVQKKKPRRLIQ